jgi:hypothetical protein
VVCTDSAQAFTHGDPTSPLAFLGRFNPAVGIYTCINPASNGSIPLIGQIQYSTGERSARIVFLMPDDGLNQPGLADLLEDLANQAGAWGAFHLLAEVEENSHAMDGLRRSGFSVYAWQRIWKFIPSENRGPNGNGKGKNGPTLWQPAASVDEVMIRNLSHSLVPPLVQSAEPLTPHRQIGWVYRQDDEILSYVEGFNGPQGIYLQPLIHPGVENVGRVLDNLLVTQYTPLRRPIYMAIRSYQAWLETAIRDLDFQLGPRQALMVKHLVIQQRVEVQVARHSVLEKYTTEPSVPLVHNSSTANK